jgi:hypothetical protein
MLATSVAIEKIVNQAKQLSPQERVHLIQRLAETMLPATESTERSTSLWRYGAFSGERMSTEEDFIIAEWHPTDEELDGP